VHVQHDDVGAALLDAPEGLRGRLGFLDLDFEDFERRP
jgi:hypothetical protein